MSQPNTNPVSTRVSYGHALCELGKNNPDVVVVDADLTTCTMTCYFAQQFPERFFNGASPNPIWWVWVPAWHPPARLCSSILLRCSLPVEPMIRFVTRCATPI